MAKFIETIIVVWQQAPLLYLVVVWAVAAAVLCDRISTKRFIAGNTAMLCGVLAYWGPIVDPQFAHIYIVLCGVPCLVAGYIACKK